MKWIKEFLPAKKWGIANGGLDERDWGPARGTDAEGRRLQEQGVECDERRMLRGHPSDAIGLAADMADIDGLGQNIGNTLPWCLLVA